MEDEQSHRTTSQQGDIESSLGRLQEVEDEEEEEEEKNLKAVNEENSGRARPRYPGAPEFRRRSHE